MGLEGVEPSRYYYFAYPPQGYVYCQFHHRPWCCGKGSHLRRTALQAGALLLSYHSLNIFINRLSKNKKERAEPFESDPFIHHDIQRILDDSHESDSPPRSSKHSKHSSKHNALFLFVIVFIVIIFYLVFQDSVFSQFLKLYNHKLTIDAEVSL